MRHRLRMYLAMVLALLVSTAVMPTALADPGTYVRVTPSSFVPGEEQCIIEWDYDYGHDTIITADGPGGVYTVAHRYFGGGVNTCSWWGMSGGAPVSPGVYRITVTPNDEWSGYAQSDTVVVEPVAPPPPPPPPPSLESTAFEWPYSTGMLDWGAFTYWQRAQVEGRLAYEVPPMDVTVKLTNPPGIEFYNQQTSATSEIFWNGELNLAAGTSGTVSNVRTSFSYYFLHLPFGVHFTDERQIDLPLGSDHFSASFASVLGTELQVKPWVLALGYALVAVAVVVTLPAFPPAWSQAIAGFATWVRSLIPQPATASVGQCELGDLRAIPLGDAPFQTLGVGNDVSQAIEQSVGSTLADFFDPLPVAAASSVYAGQTLEVSGSGFTPYGSLTMAFGLPDRDMPLANGTVVADGSGDVDLLIPLAIEAEIGSYLVMLVDESSVLESLGFYDAGGLSMPHFRVGATLVNVLRDESPPITTAHVLPAEPDGLAGWHISPVEVRLEAIDARLAIETTLHRIDGGVWQEYHEALTLDEGLHCVDYYSVDAAGNTEAVNELDLAVDCTPPRVTLDGDGRWVNTDTTFSVSAEDDTSGVSTVSIQVDGVLQCLLDQERTTVSLYEEGHYGILCWADDAAGNSCQPLESWLGLDFGPPIVVAEPGRTPDSQGWYSAAVEVTFDARDPDLLDGSPGSGIVLASPPSLVNVEGAHVVCEGQAVDAAGNTGSSSLELRLDLTPPTLAVELVGGPEYLDSERLELTVVAGDELSGLCDCTSVVDGTDEVGPLGLDLWSLPLGDHEVVTVAHDVAGNETVVVTVFSTTSSLAGLVELKHRFAALGWLGNAPGLVKSLDAHLEVASRALERQKLNVFSNAMEAFIKEVKARERTMDPRAVVVLLRDAQFLVENPN